MDRLKIAVQKSGRLRDGSLLILRECGINVDNGRDQLKAQAYNFPIDLLYLRNSDIPQYVEDGVADVGIFGENLLVEQQKSLDKVLPHGFSKCSLSIAVPKNVDYTGPEYMQGKRIATSYPHSLQQYLDQHQIQADIHVISGSVEIAPNIGLADAICDLVSTGSTLFKNGLEEKEVILRSQAWVMVRPELPAPQQSIFDRLIFRLQSVLAAKNNKYVMMNAPNENVTAITKILPGMKSPTVTPLATSGWSSIQTVISEDRFWDIIDALKTEGAEGILVIPIEKMIL